MSCFYREDAIEQKPQRKQMHYHPYPLESLHREDIRERAKDDIIAKGMSKDGHNPFVQQKHDRLDSFGFHALHPYEQRDVPPPSKLSQPLAPASVLIPPRDNGNVIAPEPYGEGEGDNSKPRRRTWQPLPDDHLRSICPPTEAPSKSQAIASMESANGEGPRHFTNRFTNNPPSKFGHKIVTPIGEHVDGVGIWGFDGVGKMCRDPSRKRGGGGGGAHPPPSVPGATGNSGNSHHPSQQQQQQQQGGYQQQRGGESGGGGGYSNVRDGYDDDYNDGYDDGDDEGDYYAEEAQQQQQQQQQQRPHVPPLYSPQGGGRGGAAPPVPQGGRPRAYHLPPMEEEQLRQPQQHPSDVEGTTQRSQSSVPWGCSSSDAPSGSTTSFDSRRQIQKRNPPRDIFANVGAKRKTGSDRFDYQRSNPRRDDEGFSEFRRERAEGPGVWGAFDHTSHTKDLNADVGQSKSRLRGGGPSSPNGEHQQQTTTHAGSNNAHQAGNFALAPPGVQFPTRENGTTVGASYRARTSMQ